MLKSHIRSGSAPAVYLFIYFFMKRFWAHKNQSQVKNNQQNKIKQTKNNKGNNFSHAQNLLRKKKSFVYVWVLFLRSKSFRKKENKQTWNCPDNLIYYTTRMHHYQPAYQEFICTHLFLFVIICENLFYLWESFLIFLICENFFFFMVICENLFF